MAMPTASASPSETICPAKERPTTSSRVRHRMSATPPVTAPRDADAHDARRDRAAVDAAEAPVQQHEQRDHAGDVADRGRERDAPHADPVEHEVEQRVQEEVAERDRRRDPVRLQAEERPVEHQHAPLKTRPALNAASAPATTGVCARLPRAALEEDADDRLGEQRADDGGRDEQERDLPQAAADGLAEGVHVAARRVARERREEHGRDRDREHPLREHVDEERLLDRRRRQVRIDEARREEHVDDGVDVDQAEPERHRDHQLEDARRPRGRASRCTIRSRPSRPRSHGIGRNTWMNVATRIEPA